MTQVQPSSRKSVTTITAFALLLIAVAVVAIGCGDSSSTSSSGSASKKNVDYATAQLAKYRQQPTFSLEAPKIDVSSLKGDTVFVMPSQSYDYCNEIDNRMKDIGAEYGVKFIEFSNQGTPQEWVKGMQEAINQEVDAIALTCGLTPDLLLPQIEAAKAAGIPVLAAHVYDAQAEADSPCLAPAAACAAGLKASVNSDFAVIGRLQADYAIANGGGGGIHSLVLPNPEIGNTVIMADAIKSELQEHCENCPVRTSNMSLADWAAKAQSETKSAALADPDLKYVFPIYDTFIQSVVAGAASAQAGSRIQAIAFNGTPFALDLLREKQTLVANVGESVEWLAYANVDQTFRILLGEPPVQEDVPVRLYDAANVAEAGTPAEWGLQGFGNSFISGYKQLWTTG